MIENLKIWLTAVACLLGLIGAETAVEIVAGPEPPPKPEIEPGVRGSRDLYFFSNDFHGFMHSEPITASQVLESMAKTARGLHRASDDQTDGKIVRVDFYQATYNRVLRFKANFIMRDVGPCKGVPHLSLGEQFKARDLDRAMKAFLN
jgi:hypothetical protein